MEIFAKARNGKMFQIGDTKDEAKWYFTSDVEAQAAVIGVKDEVIIDAIMKNGSQYLTSITKLSDADTVSSVLAPETTTTEVKEVKAVSEEKEKPVKVTPVSPVETKTYKNSYDFQEEKKTADAIRQSSIKRQAIGHMTSRTLIALQGEITIVNVEEQMARIYKKYQELVG